MTRLSVSNIAWEPSDDEAVATILNENKIDAIDIAPGKYFQDIEAVPIAEADAVRRWWADRGVGIIGMQSLLFGTSGLNLFDQSTQESMLKRLKAVFRIAEILGVTRLTFGSPRNRDRLGLDDAAVVQIASDFFRIVGDAAQVHGVIMSLEPNPACYNCNFMTTTSETVGIVEAVAHPAIKLQLDTGAVTINNEDLPGLLECYSSMIGHIHLSEPGLAAIGTHETGTDHVTVTTALRRYLPDMIATIEMLSDKAPGAINRLNTAIQTTTRIYRSKP